MQIAEAGRDLWGSVRQAASDLSEGVSSMAVNLTAYVAPDCVHGDPEESQ